MLDVRSLAPIALFLAAACATAPPDSHATAGDAARWNARDGDVLSGWRSVDVFHVPPGCTVRVRDDLSIHATEWILIEGRVEVVDRALEDPTRDAPDVRLSSAGEVVVVGELIGGRGPSFAGVAPEDCRAQPAGSGSDISVDAPRYMVRGVLRAGDGGSGAPGGDGGRGGALHVVGDPIGWIDSVALDALERTPAAGPRSIRGGAGGSAGRSVRSGDVVLSGSAGNGGDVRFDPWPDSRR